MPAKPQSVLIERWLPYVEQRRKVIFQKAPPDPVVCKPKNIIVQWEAPDVCVKKDIKHLGVICANPCEYIQRYGSSLKKACELPQFVKDIKPQCGVELAANKKAYGVPELEGDICALNLINLECEGLGMYRDQVEKFNCPPQCPEQSPCSAPCAASNPCDDPCCQPCEQPCPPTPCPAPCPASNPCPNDCEPYVYSPAPCQSHRQSAQCGSASTTNFGNDSSFQLARGSLEYGSTLFSSSAEDMYN